MADIPHLQLKEFFKLFAPKFVLGTTYTMSLAFFEGLIYPEIKRTNLQRCLILCDRVGFQRATVESTSLRSVGREYMAICAPARYSFHPKVWLMVGDGKAAVLVGSGNLTQSGFMDNVEVFDVVQLEIGGPHQACAADVAAFLAGLRSLWSGVDSRRLLALETLDDMRQEIENLARSMPNDPEPDIRLLSNFSRPLVEQFGDFFIGGSLRVVAPYFGGGTNAVRLLQERLGPTAVRVYPAVHRGDELDVALSDLQKMDGVSVGALKKEKKSGFSHLKLYGFDSEAGQWLFATSANCTLAALGGNNVEAGLLRRVQRDILEEYFTEEPSAQLPHGVRKSDFADGDSWLPFWAVDRGNAIELLVSESAMVPLSNATITIRVGGATESCNIRKLFESGKTERIEWTHFQEITDKANKSLLILLEATNSAGKLVKGASLVDNPLLLTSDPKHRSAWRAAMSLLENEGLPESADLASIYHLVQDVFDSDEDTSREKEREIQPAKSHSREVTTDKLPIWPPIASQDWFGSSSVGGKLHDLQWFQKILTELLNPKSESTEVPTSAKTADSMDDEVAKETREVQIPERAVNAVWKRAAQHYQQLQTRLSKLEITIATAKEDLADSRRSPSGYVADSSTTSATS